MTSTEARFAELFERARQPLLAYAVRRVPSAEDAADVVAETFLVAWRRIEEVPSGDSAVPWLFGVARRVLANHRRGELRRSALAERLRSELARLSTPTMMATDLQEAFDGLEEDDRELLRLVAWEELSREDIAVALGISRAAVRVRLHRARRRLRAAIEAVERSKINAMKRNSNGGHVSGEVATATSGRAEER